MTVAITRKEPGAVELRREAARCRDARAARRMLALALVLEGASREEAARAAGMDRQTLRDWVHRYNAEGLPGLHDRHRSGRKPRLTPEQEAELVTAVEQGPDPPRLSVRPRHPKADEAAQEAFKKASPIWYARRCPSTPAASRSRSGSRCYEGGHRGK